MTSAATVQLVIRTRRLKNILTGYLSATTAQLVNRKRTIRVLMLFALPLPLARMIDTVPFDMHCYSLDWHPKDHLSFVESVHLRKLASDSPVSKGDGKKRERES